MYTTTEHNVQTGEITIRDLTPEEIAEIQLAEAANNTPEKIAARLEKAVQTHLDTTVKTRGYDGIVSACSYAASANDFQAEGIAALNWRAAVWKYCYQVLEAVNVGQRQVPTAEELIAELPQLVWPT